MSACGGSYSPEVRRKYFITGPQWAGAYEGHALFHAPTRKPVGFEEVIRQYGDIGIGHWCTHDTDVIPAAAIGTAEQDKIVTRIQKALKNNDVACFEIGRVFGKQRGEETLWELKRRIGLVSPELHACFPRMRSAFNAAATGFDGHLTPTPHSPEQEAAVTKLFAEFGLTDIAHRPWWSLSVGTQRAVLFVRAVASTPPLVILDEPFQGMDAVQVNQLRSWLDTNLTPSQTLLVVTHRADELPACVTKRLTLADGRIC